MRSLRVRVAIGAALWTVGLFAVISILLTFSRPAFEVVQKIHSHTHGAVVLALVCMFVGLAIVRAGLAPFDDMRARLADVRTGATRRLEGRYASEVQPLVDDLNALLTQSDQVVTRANAKAGDLAHGLKTPLAVLSNEAERLAATDSELAATIAQQVALMRRQVDYHLAHARAAASGTALHTSCAVAESVGGLVRTLMRLHAHRGLSIETRVGDGHMIRGRREDLDEMLGNLLDNACKWAASRVSVSSSIDTAVDAGRVSILVDDDGPGLAVSRRQVVLQRGVRADEAVPGSGLGLAIVSDLAELYGGSIALEDSPMGGLRARLVLPAA